MDIQTEQQRLNELTKRSQEKAQAEADRISAFVSERRNQIERLQNERQSIMNGPISSPEAVAAAKLSLQRNKEKFLDALLKKILEDNQRSRADSFSDVSMRLTVTNDFKLSALILGAISEADLDRIGKTLTGGGPTQKQRDKKISAIDSQIRTLEGEIEEILK